MHAPKRVDTPASLVVHHRHHRPEGAWLFTHDPSRMTCPDCKNRYAPTKPKKEPTRVEASEAVEPDAPADHPEAEAEHVQAEPGRQPVNDQPAQTQPKKRGNGAYNRGLLERVHRWFIANPRRRVSYVDLESAFPDANRPSITTAVNGLYHKNVGLRRTRTRGVFIFVPTVAAAEDNALTPQDEERILNDGAQARAEALARQAEIDKHAEAVAAQRVETVPVPAPRRPPWHTRQMREEAEASVALDGETQTIEGPVTVHTAPLPEPGQPFTDPTPEVVPPTPVLAPPKPTPKATGDLILLTIMRRTDSNTAVALDEDGTFYRLTRLDL